MKRFILHVGFHKTATSSIQQTLASNQEELLKQGFYYPLFENNDSKVINHSIPFYSAFCENPEKYHINIRQGGDIVQINRNYLKQFEEILKIERNVIISGEDISVLPKYSLVKIREKIIASGFKLEVYCSVRRPYSLLCSDISEIVKSGISSIEQVTYPNRVKVVHKLKDVFEEEITFFSFEKDCNQGNPVEVFIERLGIKCSDFTLTKSNEGLGNLSTRALSNLNKNFPIIKDGAINPNGRCFFYTSIDNEKFLLTQQEFQRFKKDVDKENEDYGFLLGADFQDKSIEYSQELRISIDMAVKIYQDYAQSHTSHALLKFIAKYASFPLHYLAEHFPENVEVLRDLALVLEDVNINKSYELMLCARNLRPRGPLINSKISYYESKLSK
ncbi:hypothetical protein ACFFLZ_00620 [Photobacterium aphoticum]|uniref:Uncharacterized protein n=1 Tax=Photobacterium aphoticum TaxID=754436 RepID=A0A0J1GJC2_9GAMM|nr:hypothetical protein [Photobacterium aphoticum]KLU99769.1 hypothetical protein ABT58_14905 [Photobacterium aphoticum]PSU59545.1 hypothetical protein C9I90_03495 [Photobacterium aphoticum]GHA39847.1 hypothetical protein GCM10007086_11590 [Photobacterium aphoticum]